MTKKMFQIIIRLAKIILFYEPRSRAKQKKIQDRIDALKQQQFELKKISVLVPVYNVEQFLPKCLDSIIRQTYQNLEIICVNDASTDNSLGILNEYAVKDTRIKVVNKSENEGLPQARKTALEHASGAYVLNVDSDDWIESEMIESLYYLAQDDYDIVVCDYFKGTPNHETVVHNPKILEEGDKFKRISNRSFGYGNTLWNRFIKKESFDQVNFPIENSGEDIVINAQLYYYANKIAYFPKPFYHWQYNESSMTNKINQKTYDELKVNYDYIYNFCKEKFKDKAQLLEPKYQARLKRIKRQAWN